MVQRSYQRITTGKSVLTPNLFSVVSICKAAAANQSVTQANGLEPSE